VATLPDGPGKLLATGGGCADGVPDLTGTTIGRIRARAATRVGTILAAAFATCLTAPAFADEAAPATDNALATLCGIVESAATEEGRRARGAEGRKACMRGGVTSPCRGLGVVDA